MSKISIIFTLSVLIIVVLIFPSIPREWKTDFVFIATLANAIIAFMIRRGGNFYHQKKNVGEGSVFVENKKV